AMKRCKKLKPKLPELPDCVMSHIFSMLSLKDLVKTSALSKQWIHEWGLRMDLNFDLHNMFDYNTIQDLPKSLPLFQNFDFESEFATRLDQFVLHYQGASIRSIRVNFPLDNEHSDVIDRLISKGISKGVKRIELLFSSEINDTTTDFIWQTVPYRFDTTLLSDTDSLTYLHLQNCLLITPMDFSGLKNLTTIVLDGLIDSPSQHILSHLFSESLQLEDATFMNCQLKRTMIITSPKLRHLNIINCGSVDYTPSYLINALNLLSFEYSNHRLSIITVNAPRLLKVFLNTAVRAKTPYPFYRIPGLTHIENLAMIICPSQ
ncbi:F-box/FBD/LRR-repeat protein, partial [Trifolium medium]|nr:F-box/FBD/LRR-repeat protein [Trifolium medium]